MLIDKGSKSRFCTLPCMIVTSDPNVISTLWPEDVEFSILMTGQRQPGAALGAESPAEPDDVPQVFKAHNKGFAFQSLAAELGLCHPSS
mmetsp:Transcript_48453/g.115204  ORF Transcript_48453/g.115204 Transcript_48453/m.115204 type:complete len:89 (-) Transcript_48453:23-289(-)